MSDTIRDNLRAMVVDELVAGREKNPCGDPEAASRWIDDYCICGWEIEWVCGVPFHPKDDA